MFSLSAGLTDRGNEREADPASGTKRETTERDEGIFVRVDYRLWFETGERFRGINNGYRPPRKETTPPASANR